MKKAAIVGFGRFGELLASLGKSSFDLYIVENNPEKAKAARAQGHTVIPFERVADADFVFLAVPISEIEQTLVTLAPLVDQHHVVMDLCSVKVHPTKLMQKHLTNSQILGTHPMFGPDSAKRGLKGLQVAICPLRVEPENLKIVTDFWAGHGLDVIETTPEAHDKDSVYSQAFTYSLAKIILNMNLPNITFKTRSFNDLTEIAALSANDTEQLFHDMLFYNPYFSDMKAELQAAIAKTNVILARVEAEQAKNKP